MSERKRNRLRTKAAQHRTTDLLWRIGVGVIGGLITLIGVVALLGPGPGWLILFVGLGVLASEFAWAERALLKAKMAALSAKERALSPQARGWLIVGIVLLLALVGTGIWLYVR